MDTDSAEYADDVTDLLEANSELDFQLATDIFMDQYSLYFSRCGLALNLTKCCVIVFRPGIKTRTILLAGQEEVSSTKLLGLTVDNSYSFSKHVSKVKSTIEYRLSCLKKVLKYFPIQKRKTTAQALIFSVVKFGAEFWGREQQLYGYVQVSMNKVLREILSERYDADVKKMMTTLRWSNVANIHREAQLSSLRKLILKRHSVRVHSMIDTTPSAHLTRFRELKLKNDLEDNKFSRRSFMISACKLYNECKLHTYKDTSQNIFKNNLRQWVLNQFDNANIKNKKR